MKITLLTITSQSYWPLLEITEPNRVEYCLRHGIQRSLRTHSGNAMLVSKERIGEMLQELKSDCDWLWFCGTDTLITNHTIDVRDFLDEDYDLIIAKDINGVNNDVFFLKNNSRSEDFLYSASTFVRDFSDDQAAMVHVIGLMKDLKVKYVHQKLFNSYLYTEYTYPDDGGGNFTEGDFLLHLPGLPNERRYQIFKEQLKKVIK
jgi:hypothetical protein